MKRIDESHWQCPMCKDVFAYGDLYIHKKDTKGYKAGDPHGYCMKCTNDASLVNRKKRNRAMHMAISIATGDAAKNAARRRLEELREQRELERT